MIKYRISLLFLLATSLVAAQQRTLLDYQTLAKRNNPITQQNTNLQKVLLLQNDIIKAQYSAPQVNFTSDYLFAPFFFNNKKIIAITNAPDAKAIGYDAGITNGGIYSAQWNVSKNFFIEKTIQTLYNQNFAATKSLDLATLQALHDIDKNVADQYVNVYQAQQQIVSLNKITDIINERNRVVEQLVKKGLLPESDFLLMKIELKNQETSIEAQRLQISNAFAQLNTAVNSQDTTIFTLDMPNIVRNPLDQAYNFEKRYAADSLNFDFQQKVSELKYIPQFSIFGNAGLNSTDIRNIYRNLGFSAGAHLLIPLFDGHQREKVAQQTALQIENLKLSKTLFSTQLKTNLYYLTQQIKSIEKSLALIDEQLKTQEILLRIIKEKIVLGQVSVMDYVISLQNYALTNQSKIQTQSALWLLINQYNYINW